MKKHLIIMFVAVVVGLNPGGDADAQMTQGKNQACGMHRGMMKGTMGQAMHDGFGFYLSHAEELGLSETQIEQLRGMKYEFEKGSVLRNAEIQVAQLELQQLKNADNVDLKKVEAKIREIQDRKADVEVATFQAQRGAKSVLTSEQESKLKSLNCPMCGDMHGSETMKKGMMMHRDQDDGDSSLHKHHHQD